MLEFETGIESEVDVYEPIDSFSGDYEVFSNFYPCIIQFHDLEMSSVEHAFVASKSTDPMFWYEISQMHAYYAGKAKRKGRKIKLRSDWDAVKIPFMKEFIDQKFNQRPFRHILLGSYPRKIIEGNHWHDNFWGDCRCSKCKNIYGENHLGILLMEKRRDLYDIHIKQNQTIQGEL